MLQISVVNLFLLFFLCVGTTSFLGLAILALLMFRLVHKYKIHVN